MSQRSVLFFAFVLFANAFWPSVSGSDCYLTQKMKEEIHSHQDVVNQIIKEVVGGKYSGKYYADLTDFVDTFGNRLTGTKVLEKSIDYLVDKSTKEGLKAHTEPVEVPYWERGDESAHMLKPRAQKLGILGLGNSPGTTGSGISAPVIVVKNFKELQDKASLVHGKIVLFNPKFISYESTVKYRTTGPARAAKLGAVAALVRSVTPFSIYSPHTGMTEFKPTDKEIPAAAITLEDADLISYLTAKGKEVVVNLQMDAKLVKGKTSRNVIIDLPGEKLPDNYVTLSGHIDSWDVGQGAIDDGVGAFLALHSLYLLKQMNLRKPEKTIRAILWTGEEMGLLGAKDYLKKHPDEFKKWVAAFESDAGSFDPLGINFSGTASSYCVMKEIGSLFKALNATEVQRTSGIGSDITVFKSTGVPMFEPKYGPNNYFWYHHTDGDTMRTLDSGIMDKNLALTAGYAYVLASLSTKLPQGFQNVPEN